MRITTVLRGAASPVGTREFYDALLRVWRPHPNRKGHRLGLALSGGVDSTALATLCKRLKSWSQEIDFTWIAFIVDHKAREGSTKEAEQVWQQVQEELGLEAYILTLQWPTGTDPSKLSSFETNARTLRYQALGKACFEHRVSSLLTGHHEDDQAETVLHRLANGHKTSGLAGIQGMAHIPECWGMYGVNYSGTPLFSKPAIRAPKSVLPDNNLAMISSQRIFQLRLERRQSQRIRPLMIEGGGVTLHRPLLTFSKARLIATCLDEGLDWIEDPTNRDPTLTFRNACRSVLSLANLPVALQKRSILSLAKTKDRSQQRRETFVDYLFTIGHVKVLKFDTRAGTLDVRFPEDIKLKKSAIDDVDIDAGIEKIRTARLILRKLAMAVSPKETIESRAFSNWVYAVFGALGNTVEQSNASTDLPNAIFNIGGVRFEALNRNVWRLSRQFYDRNDQPIIEINGTTDPAHMPYARFQLWDGRFWIKVENRTPQKLCVRHFEEADMEVLNGRTTTGFRYRDPLVMRRIKDITKGHIRWTLPVIAFPDDENGGKGNPVAFPTLNVVLAELQNLLEWDVRYKAVDVAALGAESILNDPEAVDWPLLTMDSRFRRTYSFAEVRY